MSGKVQIVPQVVVSTPDNPPSNRSGAIQTRDPSRHSDDGVLNNDRPFSTRISSFSSRNTNEPSPYPGTIAYVLRQIGRAHV